MNKPRLARTLLGAAAALPLSLASPAMAADHRDAPTIDDYSAIDINDVFLFRDPPCTTAICTSPNLVVALSSRRSLTRCSGRPITSRRMRFIA